MNLQSAPANWHATVNFPVGLVWIVGIPFAACSLLQIPLWWVILIAPVWALLTGRISDRWLPAITGPVIDRIFIAMGGERKPPGPLKPESDYIVEVTASYIRSTRPDGTVEEIPWEEITGFEIETNSLGPFAPDVFWVLRADGRFCTVPQGATGDGELLEQLEKLPGFDNGKFIDAVASTSDATFKIWRDTNNTEKGLPPKSATRSESEPEGSDKPQPESEPRPGSGGVDFNVVPEMNLAKISPNEP